MRLIEIRLLDGPNLYRLEPAVKLEVAVGRRRSWSGRREPERYALVRLGARVPRAEWPPDVERLAGWAARLGRLDAPAGSGRRGPRLSVHRSSDPGHWILAWSWSRSDRARAVADASWELASRGVSADPAAALGQGSRRLLDRWLARIDAAGGDGPAWLRDADRSVPIVSISGTNGKSTTTRLLTHILHLSGRHVGTTTSDGVLVDEALVEPGDWTGPAGAKAVLDRPGLEVAVLETARGGILLRGIGYESNDASILTNVSSDHLDLQGIHTLPELAEVKATIARITRPEGWVVLNADDRFVAEVARTVRARVALFSLGDPAARRRVSRHLARGGRAYLLRDGVVGEAEGATWRPIAPVERIPIAFGGVARHNVANALAAAGGARALGASIQDVRRGLQDFEPSSGASPGRLNVFRRGARVVIIDFAHNEAGIAAVLDVAEAIRRGLDGGSATLTTIVGTAGDRPDDTLRGMGRIAAERSNRVAIKETLIYLRGRSRQGVIGELTTGARGAGWKDEIPVYESEVAALAGELDRTDGPEVIVLLCHAERDAVFARLGDRGFEAVDAVAELAALIR